MLWKIIIPGFVGLLLAIISLTVFGQVTVTQTPDGNVVLNGDVNGMNPERQPAASQSTTSSFYMNKQIWRRDQQDWHSPGFGAESMRTFVNNALASGIRLAKIGTSTTQIDPSIFICLNDAGRLLMYCFHGEAKWTPPGGEEPVSCTVDLPTPQHLGIFSSSDPGSLPVLLRSDIRCDANTSVRISVESLSGTDTTEFGPALKGRLRIGSGQTNTATVDVRQGVPYDPVMSVQLMYDGTPDAGDYTAAAIVSIRYN